MNKQLFTIISSTALCVLLTGCGNRQAKKIEEKKQSVSKENRDIAQSATAEEVVQAEEITEIVVHLEQKATKTEQV